ncbi:MAG: SDR family oxidoreductase [Actinomycetota bacterium]|nr:SDR family oxidoreductase [Actinomycetota bacterium]
MVPQVALVTGAGRGIGRAVALRLSSEGMRVVLTARSTDELATTAEQCPGETAIVAADITEPDAAERIFTAAEQRWGRVDVLVANAGSGTSSPLEKTTDEDWQHMLELNLTAPFRCVRRAVGPMRAAGFGRIVVIASVAARVGEPYITAYTASKHGVLGVVRSAAAELATCGVTVNAVCPGYVDTPMTERTVASIVAVSGRDADQVRETLARKQPTGRLITPEEVAEAVSFCVRMPGMTGQGIIIDGGAVQG